MPTWLTLPSSQKIFSLSTTTNLFPVFISRQTASQRLCPTSPEGKICMLSDVWVLACTVLKYMRDFPFSRPCLREWWDPKEIMATLGKLPDPWSAFWNHHLWSDEDGKPKARELQVLLPAEKTSIDLDEVGQDRGSTSRWLCYCPQDRI